MTPILLENDGIIGNLPSLLVGAKYTISEYDIKFDTLAWLPEINAITNQYGNNDAYWGIVELGVYVSLKDINRLTSLNDKLPVNCFIRKHEKSIIKPYSGYCKQGSLDKKDIETLTTTPEGTIVITGVEPCSNNL